MIRSLKPYEYWPTSARAGNETRKIFRMRNLILRGEGVESYAEVYGGSLNLNENIPALPLTGTMSVTAGDTIIVGAGTSFTTELHLGQFVEIYTVGPVPVTIPVVVDEIIDNTHFRACRRPLDTVAGASAFIFPVIFEMNKKRATLLRGNAVEVDLGSIIAVGKGELRRNGALLAGDTLDATRSPQIALFDAGNYTVFTLGMATPVGTSAAAEAGGTKNMQGGTYSVREVPARLETRGYNNPSAKAEVTIATGEKIRVTAAPADTANGQNARMFFVTMFTQGGGINGPWFRHELPGIMVPVGAGVGEIPAAGGTYDIEYNDAEISSGDLLTFNNDPPPDAEFVLWMAGMPMYLSCLGPGDTSPGPFIATGKPRNVEAVPPTQYVSTSPPDTIIGGLVGVQGRAYLMCVNSLQIAVATQQVDPRLPAFVVRPFWRSGFQNPETLIPIGDNLVGMTTNGLARSISEGDEGSEEYNFAVAVEELVRGYSPGHCLLKLDPKNNAVVLFMSAFNRNASGFWTTRALMYGLRENRWIGDILLTSATGDMIVCSAATVNGQLEFLCGGRQTDGTTLVRTLRWDDENANEEVPYYIAWQLGDDGVEDRPKAVTALRLNGQISQSGELQVHGMAPGQQLDLGLLESMTTGLGPIVPPAVQSTQYDRVEVDYDNLMQWTVKVLGTWLGVGESPRRDRIDEVTVESRLRGARR